MRYLLSRMCRRVAARVAAQKTLCAFDYDGTLAPIVAHPARARIRDTTRRLLARLAALYPCAVISGRSRQDVLGRLRGTGVTQVVGNHGAEAEKLSRDMRRDIESWLSTLTPAVAPLAGVWVEDKGYSLAVHYRQSGQKALARRSINAAVGKLHRVRVIGGKQVVNLVPADAPDKGEALALERRRQQCDWALYVGDDDTDEDAFALDDNIVAVRIGRKPSSHAGYYLREQREIDNLLELLVRLRANVSVQGLGRARPAT